jgi:hypothetical protein
MVPDLERRQRSLDPVTRLGGCVKTHLPQPDGEWGMASTGDVDATGAPVLVYIAFGSRHPTRPWQASVYRAARRRVRPPHPR